MSLSRTIAKMIVEKNIPISDAIEVLQSYDLLPLLPAIKSDIEKLAKDEGDRETIHIESPFPLSEKALSRIKRIVGNDLAHTEVTINEHLLAGFKARYKGRLYDGSAERIIKQFTK
jgi:F0F1-type ATP synthase delta subunit